jgi:hypothetical protein
MENQAAIKLIRLKYILGCTDDGVDTCINVEKDLQCNIRWKGNKTYLVELYFFLKFNICGSNTVKS